MTELRLSTFHHILFLIHGYNNTEEFAETNYARFTTLLDRHLRRHPFDIDAIVNFHWPGNPALNLGLFAPTIHYPYALINARRGALLLAEFLAALPRPNGIPTSLKLSLVGHSMGCRLVMEMLRAITANRAPDFKCMALMAAAIPVELVTAGGELLVPSDMNERILKFFSPNDLVLRNLFPLGQRWSSAFVNEGKPVEARYYKEAVGYYGNPGSFALAYSRHDNGHSDYWNDDKVVGKVLNKVDPTYAIPADNWEIASSRLDVHQLDHHDIV